jgi:hypothetical protein
VFLLFGVISGINSLRAARPVESGRIRFLIALHDSSKAGFWLSLGAFFLGFALIEEIQSFRWFAMIPLAMAGLRLVTAALLARG